ncbi:hypothetical protein NKI96_24260 [Mesorhizobium sp. M0292]|uniref:hypothetical protein n=1 Tax=Mesorhizobium sp. M0292 TaxID=2956929 RepID=UPI00333AA511
MSSPWTTSVKSLKPVGHVEPPSNTVVGSFGPPSLGRVSIAPADLFKSIARCSALSRSSASLVAAVVASSQALLEFLVDDATSVIAFLDEVADLADAERTALSGRVGAGITDQTMDMLGFVWRDLAEQLVSSSKPLADYVYEGATGTLVLAEAKGSISSAAAQSGANTRARNAYRRQVDPYVFTRPPAPGGGASIGLIEHGYAVAFAALPGPAVAIPPTIGAGAFLAVAETDRSSGGSLPGGPSTSSGGTTSSSTGPAGSPALNPTTAALRLGNYRAVFLLANAPAVVETVDAALGRLPLEYRQQEFLQVQCGGNEFLVGRTPVYPAISSLESYLHGWVFAIALASAEAFLQQLANQSFVTGLPIQALVRAASEKLPSFLLSPDGFAMLRRDAAMVTHDVTWDAKAGLSRRPIAHRAL